MKPAPAAPRVQGRMRTRLSIDDSDNGWDTWKKHAEDVGLPKILSKTAIMLLWLSLGTNAWQGSAGDYD